MDYTQVKDLIKTINESTFVDFEIKMDNAYMKISKVGSGASRQEVAMPDTTVTIAPPVAVVSPLVVETPTTIIPVEKPVVVEGHLIKSPIVGTFYATPGPDQAAFVKVGDTVKQGDVLCILEAMKIMNEITSSQNGTVAEIFSAHGDMVEFGQPLFRIV